MELRLTEVRRGCEGSRCMREGGESCLQSRGHLVVVALPHYRATESPGCGGLPGGDILGLSQGRKGTSHVWRLGK